MMNAPYFTLVMGFVIGLFGVHARGQTEPSADVPTTQPGVTLINLHMSQAMPEDVFTELAKQGGVKFNNNGNLWEQDALQTPIDVDLTNKPFWQAMREVCGLTKIFPQPVFGLMGRNGKRIQIEHMQGQMARDWALAPTFDSPSVMVQAQSLTHQQTMNYVSQPNNVQDFCNLQLLVYVDPALNVQSFNQNLRAEEAVDESGNSMLLDSHNGTFFGGSTQRSLIYQCQLPLKFPDNAGNKIAHLKFTLNLRVAGKMEALSVDKPLDAAEQMKDLGDTTIAFESAKKTENGFQVKVGVSQDQSMNNPWGLLQTAQLLDENGRAFTHNGGGGGGAGGDNGLIEYTINYASTAEGADASATPAKWVIEMPSDTRSMKIPVEFKDLPLP